jgi:hypothetical protein
MMVDSFEQRIIDVVASHGWFGLSVAPREDSDDPQEWWTYTVGLAVSHSWPELVVFGQDANRAHGILDAAIKECEAAGVIPHPGMRLRNTLNGYDAVLVEGSGIPAEYLNSANWFARHNGLYDPQRLQLLWPDRQGHFPFEPDCDADVRSLQTPVESA